jgi:hypothetical protein
VLDKHRSLGKAKVSLGAHSIVIKMLVAAVSCFNVVVDICSPDLAEIAQGIAAWLYDKETETHSTLPVVRTDALEQELEIKKA